MSIVVIILMLMVYTYIVIDSQKCDKKSIKKNKVDIVLKNSRDSALSGGMFGLLSGGPSMGLKNGFIWACIGGMKTFMTYH